MKSAAAVLLLFGFFSNSVFSKAEEPIPFRALMQTAGSPQEISPTNGAHTPATQPAAPIHKTRGGKAMIGAGIGMVVIGGGVCVMTGIFHDWASPARKAALFGGGAGVAGVGITLIVIGDHRHSTH